MNTLQKIAREVPEDKKIADFSVGDTIRADVSIVEGDKERIQSLNGTVISRRGSGIAETVTIRRVSYGQGVEHVLPLYSPRLARIQVLRRGKVRRSKLYYIRHQQGKSARIKELR